MLFTFNTQGDMNFFLLFLLLKSKFTEEIDYGILEKNGLMCEKM